MGFISVCYGRTWAKAGKKVAKMSFNTNGGVINWFPGHMAAASRAIRDRLKLVDLVIKIRDARIPLTLANEDLQIVLSSKKLGVVWAVVMDVLRRQVAAAGFKDASSSGHRGFGGGTMIRVCAILGSVLKMMVERQGLRIR